MCLCGNVYIKWTVDFSYRASTILTVRTITTITASTLSSASPSTIILCVYLKYHKIHSHGDTYTDIHTCDFIRIH